MAIQLTDRERAVLAHVVIDPDEWVSHAEAVFGEAVARECLAEKVAKHAAGPNGYDAAVAELGEAYQTRAQREAA